MADNESNSEETGVIFLRKVPVVICNSDEDSYVLEESTEQVDTEQEAPEQDIPEQEEMEQEEPEQETTEEQELADDTELR